VEIEAFSLFVAALFKKGYVSFVLFCLTFP
jgi:hypothetical protein